MNHRFFFHDLNLSQLLRCAALMTCIGAMPSHATERSGEPLAVETFTVVERTIPEWSEYHGVVASRTSVDMIALATGRIKAVHVKVGQAVRRGDVLVELESREAQARFAEAQSRLASAESALRDASGDLDRYKRLAEEGVVSPQKLSQMTDRGESARAVVAIAKAQLSEAETMLSHTVLRSPIDGIVVNKSVNPGDFTMPVLPASFGSPAGRILMEIYDPRALWFEVSIPERYSRTVKVGGKAGVVIGSANLSIQSRFVEVEPSVDERARTFTARINLPRKSDLKLGMFGRVRFVSGQYTALTIPEVALLERGQLDVVFVHADGQARLRLVRCGKRNSGQVEILSGLASGDKVILNPPKSLRDGDQVDGGRAAS